MRPAGILIPDGAGQRGLQAGFGQIEAQVMKPGMVAEATCISKPWVIIPMVVTSVQDFIAAGQFRGGEQLIDAQNAARPGTILVFLEPLYKDGLDGVTPGSSCIVNAYTSNHDVIADKKTGALKGFALHAVDARRPRACAAAADPGAAVADQDAGAERSLMGVLIAAFRNPILALAVAAGSGLPSAGCGNAFELGRRRGDARGSIRQGLRPQR